MLKIHSLITWKFKVYTTLWNTKNSIYYMFVGSILHKQYFFCFSGIMVGFYTFCESITSIMSTVFFFGIIHLYLIFLGLYGKLKVITE